jgi:hypothetical protein
MDRGGLHCPVRAFALPLQRAAIDDPGNSI